MPTGVYVRTPKYRDKMSKAMMGHKHSEETREKMSKRSRGENNSQWNGGFIKNHDGYVLSKQSSGDYIFVHRLVMAEYLKRPLTKEETIHHINRDKTDNRRENLMLFKNNGEHLAYHKKLRKEKILL